MISHVVIVLMFFLLCSHMCCSFFLTSFCFLAVPSKAHRPRLSAARIAMAWSHLSPWSRSSFVSLISIIVVNIINIFHLSLPGWQRRIAMAWSHLSPWSRSSLWISFISSDHVVRGSEGWIHLESENLEGGFILSPRTFRLARMAEVTYEGMGERSTSHILVNV